MNDNSNRPKKYDLVLGGNNPPPIDGVVLGGIEGVKSRLASDNIQSQISALSEAFNYGDRGLDLVIDALNNYKREVRKNAYRLLQQREEKKAKVAVSNYKFWSDFEYLNGLPEKHAKTFAHRKVEVYDPNIGIIDPVNTAYFIKQEDFYEKRNFTTITIKDKFMRFWQDPKISEVEALIFGYYGYREYSTEIIDLLVDACEWLINLKALFIGDIQDREMMISSIHQGDISPIFKAYPELEILHIRGGRNLRFSEFWHDELKAIRIETGGLSRITIEQICAYGMPELEYLELWMGKRSYGGDSSINDVMPIIQGNLFPKLKYLGLRNAEYTDEIAFELVKSPLLKRLVELDLSLGTLGIEGAEALYNCPAINELDTLNLSNNYLWQRHPRILELSNKLLTLDCTVIIDEQNYYNLETNSTPVGLRYCSVGE